MKLLNIIVPNLSIIVHILSDFFSGPDITAVKSITKCIRILSPAKNQRSSLDQENCLASN